MNLFQHQRNLVFASTRSVQIATAPSAACRRQSATLPPHAPCRLQQERKAERAEHRALCLHTLRADCNADATPAPPAQAALPPHAPCRLQRAAQSAASIGSSPLPPHAPCRLQHRPDGNASRRSRLCLHTLRADCNKASVLPAARNTPLPPHAPCRLQHRREIILGILGALPPHAPCRLQRQKCTECNMHFSERVLSR